MESRPIIAAISTFIIVQSALTSIAFKMHPDDRVLYKNLERSNVFYRVTQSSRPPGAGQIYARTTDRGAAPMSMAQRFFRVPHV